MEQTPVEWLENKIEDQRENGNDDLRTTLHYCKQAKEIEKQQQDNFAIEFTEWLCDYEITKEQIKTRLEIFKNK